MRDQSGTLPGFEFRDLSSNYWHVDVVYNLAKSVFGAQTWLDRDTAVYNALQRRGIHISMVDTKTYCTVGVLLLSIEDAPKSWVFLLVVDPACQCEGIGSALLAKAFSLLPPTHTMIIVDVGANDLGALAFYEKMGFAEESRIKGWFGDETGVLMVRRA